MKLKAAIVLCLLLSIGITAYAGFWSSGIYPVSKLGQPDTPCPSSTGSPTATPSPSATATATPTATATGTPGPLPAAITALLSDQETGVTNPLPTLCAASTVSVPNGGTNSGACTTAGSVNVASIPTNGADAGPTLQTAINAGDVNLPAGTYTINTQVNVPSWRTIQCQPGAVITTTATTIKTLNFTNSQSDMVVGCTFAGPGAGTASAAYAIFISGGQNINAVGNTFTGWPSTSAVTVSAGTDDLFELNRFSGNHDSGLNTSGSTHIVNNLNNLGGVLAPKIPSITHLGGTKRERDLWTVFDALGASGTGGGDGYSVVQPGAVFSGATCSGNGSSDDTNCIKNALAASSVGILVMPGTGSYRMNGTAGNSSAIVGSQLSGKTVLCAPGARFLNPNTSGNITTFQIGGQGQSGGSNINILGCEMYGTYVNEPFASANFASDYSEQLQMATNSTSQVHTIGADFEGCFGDCWISYSPCGTMAPDGSNSCTAQSVAAASSGPNDLSLLFSNFFGSDQSCVHLNGGQNQHIAFNNLTDCSIQPEIDTNVFQIIKADLQHNYVYSIYGLMDQTGNLDLYVRPVIEGAGRTDVGANYSGMSVYDNVADGSKTVNTSPNNYSGNNIDGNTSAPFLYAGISKSLSESLGCLPGTFSGAQAVNNAAIVDPGC